MKIPESSRAGLPADLIGWFAVLMGFQLAGETLSRLLALPIPGPVIGLALLVGALLLVPSAPASLEKTADGLLSRLAVMFVPAGVGVVQNLGVLAGHAGALLIAILVSTVVGMVVTALVYRWVGGQEEENAQSATARPSQCEDRFLEQGEAADSRKHKN